MSGQQKNHYAVLGVTPTASIEQIRSAYRDKVRIVHPDSAVVASPTASQQMTDIGRAWATLSDPARRRAYDASLLNEVSEVLPQSTPPVVRGRFPTGLVGGILVVGIVGVLVLNILSDPPKPSVPDGLLQSGSCVVVDTNKLAVEVGCETEHFGVVRQLIGFDMSCPTDTEPIRDRQGMGLACVVPSQ